MVKIRMRLLPSDYSYSKSFHILFSTLCKEVRRTPQFYSDLAKIRHMIKTHEIDVVLSSLATEDCLSNLAIDYFDKMKKELPLVGQELQAKCLAYLMSLKDKEN